MYNPQYTHALAHIILDITAGMSLLLCWEQIAGRQRHESSPTTARSGHRGHCSLVLIALWPREPRHQLRSFRKLIHRLGEGFDALRMKD